MGRPKLALPLGDRTVLERVVAAFRGAGVEQILVVLAPHTQALADLARAAGAETMLLPEETPDMRATVEHGLDWIARHWQPADHDGWLLAPADHPLLDAAVIGQLLAAWHTFPEPGIVVPTYQGRRGHPVLISWHHVRSLRALPPGQGLNVYLRQQASETVEVAVTNPEVLCDLDTPADYERLRRGEG
jgi:molybdenum cofactor cytidylyltransferase